jgi:hypothetical protein
MLFLIRTFRLYVGECVAGDNMQLAMTMANVQECSNDYLNRSVIVLRSLNISWHCRLPIAYCLLV